MRFCRWLSVLLTVSVFLSSSFAATEITSSMAGMTLTSGVYEVRKSLTLKGGTGTPGLKVEEGATVAVYLKKYATLTLSGGNGSRATPGAAGFEIPESSTLILVGEGSVSATGGAAGAAENGGNGGSYGETYEEITSGAGGAGGCGAGGAAAGIGGSGGAGGAGGTGGESRKCDRWSLSQSGAGGGDGGSGTDGGTMGELYALGSVTVSGTAGAVGSQLSGDGGEEGESRTGVYFYSENFDVGGGAGGGGGGVTYDEPADIGGGAGGGGAGGGGGSGGICQREYIAETPKAGGGAGGSCDGIEGLGTQSTTYGGVSGGAGGKGGEEGARGRDGHLFVSEGAGVTGGTVEGTRETHEFLRREVVFDADGGRVGGAATASRDAYLYLTLPDMPIPDRDKQHLFLGYFTGRNGAGKQYFDTTGAPLVDFWDLDVASTTLYAAWREVTLPAEPLVVTTLGDAAFDPDTSAITLRAAVTWAMLYPDLTGADGTPSRISFAEDLWQGTDSATVRLTRGRIRVCEKRFSDHPLIVAGPGMAACAVTVDGSGMTDRLFDVASDNRVQVADLSFGKGKSPDSGGAIRMRGDGSLLLTNCVFKSNTAKGSGGAVAATEASALTVCNCHFEKGESSSAWQGGGAICGGQGTGRRTLVLNSSFWENTATYGGAVYGSEETTLVNCSIFRNEAFATGGGVYAGGTNGSLAMINCTVVGNVADCEGDAASATAYTGGAGLYATGAGEASRTVLVNSFFIGNRPSTLPAPDVEFGETNAHRRVLYSIFGSADGQIAPSVADKVLLGKTDTEFFESDQRGLVYRETVRDGLKHNYLMTTDSAGDVGLSVYHDADWRNVAYSREPGQAKTALRGDADRADVLLAEDISGRDLRPFAASHSQEGSFWYVHDRPEFGTVVTKIEDVSDYYDGVLTLREIIDGIATEEDLWRTNLADGVYTVTFAEKFRGQTLRLRAPQFDVYGLTNAVSIVIDGEDKDITIDGDSELFEGTTPLYYRAFRIRPNATVTLKNLTFVNCVGLNKGQQPVPGCDGGAILNCGTTTVENCSFASCSTGLSASDPTAFGGAICNGAPGDRGGCVLVVRDSSFSGCLAAAGGAVYNYEGNSATLSGCAFSGNRAHPGKSSTCIAIGGAVCTVSSGELVYGGCAFADNTVLLDGKVVSSDVQAKVEGTGGGDGGVVTLESAKPYRTVRYAAAVLTSELNVLALPEAESMALDTTSGAKMPDGVTPAVTMRPTGLVPGLIYGLGHADDPGASFEVEEGTWQTADGKGALPGPLLAPATGDRGFYRVFARE